MSGISWANAQLANETRKPLYCQPDSLVLQPEQVISMVKEYLKKNPAHSKFPMGTIILKVLMSTFPWQD